MCDRAGDLDAEQTRDTEKKPEDAGDETAPDEGPHVPLWAGHEREERPYLAIEKHERSKESSGPEVGPPGELYGGVAAIGQRRLYEDGMNSNEERREHAIEKREGRGNC